MSRSITHNLSSPVLEYMSQPVFSVGLGTSLQEARRRLTMHRVSSLVVTGGSDRIEGIVSLTDLLRASNAATGGEALELPAAAVESVMTREVVRVAPRDKMIDAARKLLDHRVHRVIVEVGGRAQGVLSTKDLTRALIDARVSAPIEAYMSSPVAACTTDSTLRQAVRELEATALSAVVVVDENGFPVGIFSQAEAVAAGHLADDTPVEEVMSARVLTLGGKTAIHRAAAHVAVNRVRRVVALEDGKVVGILSGLDFARVAVHEFDRASA